MENERYFIYAVLYLLLTLVSLGWAIADTALTLYRWVF